MAKPKKAPIQELAEELHKEFCTECTDEHNCSYYKNDGTWVVRAEQVVRSVDTLGLLEKEKEGKR